MAEQRYRRPASETLKRRLMEPRRFLQVLAGPRQAGKTTLAHQVAEELGLPAHIASADDPAGQSLEWLRFQWDQARELPGPRRSRKLLILDEVQKIPRWSEVVKAEWDRDSAEGRPLHVVLLGSAPLLVQQGLAESLAGRFELIRVGHWSYSEMRDAFGWDLDRYLYYGGYPGSASLVSDPDRWRRYILDSIIETAVARDILLMTRVDKPALLRQLFRLACDYSGQVLSYQKMLGQLQDAGNVTTLAHYLELLAGAGMVRGVPKYSGSKVRQRASSPKLLVLNNALATAISGVSFREARARPEVWGRLVESAVGAHLERSATAADGELFYWRAGDREVDWITVTSGRVTAIEVTSGRRKSPAAFEALAKEHRVDRRLLVGAHGVSFEEFLNRA